MNEKFLKVEDIMEILGISKSAAYKLMRELNEEMVKKGYIAIRGRVNRKYFEERFYGMSDEMNRQIGMVGEREVFMNITYENNGNYLIPNIVANPEPEGELRKFGLMRQSYLKEWHKGIYTGLSLIHI